jgi:hypothetical protein
VEIMMKAFLSTVAASALLVSAAQAAPFTINFGDGSTSSNAEPTGVTASVLFEFTDVGDDVEIKLTVDNTSDEAVPGTLTAFLFDVADGVTLVDGSVIAGDALDVFDTNAAFMPFSNDPAVGNFDIAFSDDGNIEGGNPNDALAAGMVDMMSFIVSGDFDADSLSQGYFNAFASGAVEAAVRFMQVGLNDALSDKLLNGTVIGNDLVMDDLGSPVPIPGAALFMLTALGAGAAGRKLRRH